MSIKNFFTRKSDKTSNSENEESITITTTTTYPSQATTPTFITEEILKNRLIQEAPGAFYPQIIITIGVCFGAFSFGNILGWGGPAWEQIRELEHDHSVNQELIFDWVVSLSPLGTAVGIPVWAYITRRIGPKRSMMVAVPFLLTCWFLQAYYNEYEVYCSVRFFIGLLAANYIYCGKQFLIETVHRTRLKTMYALYRCSITLGILYIDIISAFLDRTWICVLSATTSMICFMILLWLPESPVFLMYKSTAAAERSLSYYRGKASIATELHVIKQYIAFQRFASQGYMSMLYSKVVIKTVVITTALQIFRTMSGYYAFTLDSVRIFSQYGTLISPYLDNIIFGVVLVVARFVGTMVHVRTPFGIKAPMLVSTCLMTIVLTCLGIIFYMAYEIGDNKLKWLLLVMLCLFAVSYESGIELCPDIVLYEYSPYQIYDYLSKVMMFIHWLLVFCALHLYMYTGSKLGEYVNQWSLAVLSFVGMVFIGVAVVESKGKPLVAIQIELGGNPVGNRGSRRQRIANPLEPYDAVNYLHEFINTANQQTTSHHITV